jgi:transcriptional regulator NrdR family protein
MSSGGASFGGMYPSAEFANFLLALDDESYLRFLARYAKFMDINVEAVNEIMEQTAKMMKGL